LKENMFERLNLINMTDKIEKDIDRIIISKHFQKNLLESKVFVEKGTLSDHKGIFITL